MYLNAIGTALPERRYTKSECWDAFAASQWFERLDARSRLIAKHVLTRNNGIEARRLSVASLEDVFTIDAAVIRVGRSSMRSVQKMLNGKTGALVATCVGVDALFDLAARRSAPWPDDLREMLEAALFALPEADRALFER